MAKKFESIMPGVYLVGRSERNPGIVYFRRMFNGKRKIQKATLQGALALDLKGRPTKALKKEAANWTASLANKAYIEKREGLHEMTFADLMREYPKAAELERVKSGKPSETTVTNTLKAVTQFMAAAGLKSEEKCSKLTTDLFDVTITLLIKNGRTKTTAWTYAAAMQTASARWAESYFRRAGFKPPQFVLPAKRNMKPQRYARPTKAQLDQVAEWYEKLWKEPDKRMWLAATMMLQFAMRNGDAILATPEIFQKRTIKTKEGKTVERMVLCYTPHKTSTSSGRSVAWPVAPGLWERIEEARKAIGKAAERTLEDATNLDFKEGEAYRSRRGGIGWWRLHGEEQKGNLIPFGHMTYLRINKELRKIFPEAQKASYELRKICIDHIYQSRGPAMASAISGDDLKTVTYYYADPSQAIEQDGVDIAELL